MVKKLYKVKGTTHTFRCKSDDPEDFSHAIKVSVARKLNIHSADWLFENFGIEIKKCGFCGFRSNRFNLEVSIVDNEVDIGGVNFNTTAISGDNFYCYGYNKTCGGKTLNPNSIEFIKITRGLETEDQAIEYIHSRNSSPFYKSNYADEDEYKRAQSRNQQWFKENGKSREDWINKANYSRSIEGMIEKYGIEEGTRRWKDNNKLKAGTLERFTDMYGEKDGLKKYKDKNQKSSASLKNYERKFGKQEGRIAFIKAISDRQFTCYNDLVNYGEEILSREPTSILISYPALKKLKNVRTIEIGCKIYKKSLQEFISDIKKSNPVILSRKDSDIKWGKYNIPMVYLEDGTLLRSSLEIYFHDKIKLDHPDWEMIIDKKYEDDANYRFDFYFPQISSYIEIAGLMRLEEYTKRLEIKVEKYKPLIASNIEEINKVIRILEKRFDKINRQ